MPTPDPNLDKLLRTAIEQTRLLRLSYRNKDRIVEPHDYVAHSGAIKLLTYQVGGSTSGILERCCQDLIGAPAAASAVTVFGCESRA